MNVDWSDAHYCPLCLCFFKDVNKRIKELILPRGNCNLHLENGHVQMGHFETPQSYELQTRGWIGLNSFMTKLH